MRRLLSTIAIALLLGVVTTFIVAWSCALWVGLDESDRVTVTGVRDATRDAHANREYKRTGIRRTAEVTDDAILRVVDARGWPFLALRGEFDINSADGRGMITDSRSSLILDFRPPVPGSDKSFTQMLPFSPIWQGLGLNSLFYGVIWLGVFIGLARIRSLVRQRRGLCPTCGGELDVFTGGCPNCRGQSTEHAE